MALSKEQLQERAQLIRMYEAACSIAHPDDEDKRFRCAVMRKIGLEYGLREMRQWTVGGNTPPTQRATQPVKPSQPPRRD
jgi:hypothetical protein